MDTSVRGERFGANDGFLAESRLPDIPLSLPFFWKIPSAVSLSQFLACHLVSGRSIGLAGSGAVFLRQYSATVPGRP